MPASRRKYDGPMGDETAVKRVIRAARIWSLDEPEPMRDAAVVVVGGRIDDVYEEPPEGDGFEVVDLGDVDLAPGFVDVQVNGGGGVLLNETPTVEGIAAIARAHRAFGTTSLLPTLITDTVEVMAQARAAVNEALAAKVPGVVGVHFEGPFLDPRKAGAHDAGLVRAASDGDIEALFDGAPAAPTLVTAACVGLEGGTLGRLLERGAIVSLGHCAGSARQAAAAFAAGVRGVTHLFNAMSPMESRAPGVVGAALAADDVYCGLISDGHHVAFPAARAAWRAIGTDRMMLVTDAVQSVGTDLTEFRLGGQTVRLEDGRCVNESGNLAGSHLDMMSAVRHAVRGMGVPLVDALRMASETPAHFLGLQREIGGLRPGMRADLVAFDREMRVTWVS